MALGDFNLRSCIISSNIYIYRSILSDEPVPLSTGYDHTVIDNRLHSKIQAGCIIVALAKRMAAKIRLGPAQKIGDLHGDIK